MIKAVQAGQIVFIRDEFYADNNLTIMEVPRYSWKITKLDNAIATCEFLRRGRNSLLTLTIECKYLRIEMI